MATNMRLKKGDKVRVITGKDKGKEGKILVVDKEHNRVIVEGVNKVTKHQKASRGNQQGGILNFEASIHASNVMYLHNGKPTRIAYKVERVHVNDRDRNVKHRIAVTTGDQID